MKVAFIIPSLGSGGAERVFSSLLNDWVVTRKCDVELIILMKNKEFYKIEENVNIHRINFETNNKFKLFSLFKLIYILRNKLKEIKPDICFSFIRESNLLTLMATQGINTKVVISERDSPNAHVSKIYQILRKKLYPLCDGLIVQTEEYKKFVYNEISRSIKQIVIPNPVRDIQTEENPKEKIILNVARLIPIKGQKYLLESFAKCNFREGWRLVILGDGLLKNELIEYANELGIGQYVSFLGATPEVDYWLKKSSIFAFTSLSEGFPNALAEAMSASLPCVSFDCITGPKDLICDEESGYLVELLDTDSFSKKLDILMQNNLLRENLGKSAKKVATSLKFDIISQRYFNFLKDILDRKS